MKVALAQQEIAEAELRAAKAKATPDVTVGVEYEYNREFDQSFNMVGLNLESDLPILDTNVAGIRAAKPFRAALRSRRLVVWGAR